MKPLLGTCLVLALALGFAPAAFAGEAAEVTLDGSVMCAKCALGKADDCQDVLVVAEGDAKGEYWIAKNDVSKGFGHQCQSEKLARVTGSLSEQDGQRWITPTAMEAPAG
jgi:hypothetical protein